MADEEFSAARGEIRDLNAQLKQTPCDAALAERRVTLFMTHQQTSTARRLAKKFLEKCGENANLRSVADGAK